MATSLEGKRALITGAGGGMGRSHAVLLAERGVDIIIHDIKADGAEETAEMVRAHGREATVLVEDIRGVSNFTNAVKGVGPVDILVNNAGVGGERRSIEEIDQEAYDRMFDIHVRGTFFATQAVLPAMKQKKSGKIVNISSIFAMGGCSFACHYAAAKSAISGFTKSWARELARWRINVNAVAPGYVVTEMTQETATPEMLETHEASMPLGEFCKPIDISYAVAWLASAETDMITGQVISPNSGEVIVGY